MFLPKDFDSPLLVLVVRGTPDALQNPAVIQGLLEQYGHSPISIKQPFTFDRFLASRSVRYAVDPKRIQDEARNWPKYLKDDQYHKGLYQFALGHDSDAVSLLLPSRRTSIEALVASGLAEYRQGHLEQADELWTQALGRQARDPIVLNNLAVTKAQRKQLKNAQELFGQAFTAIEPGDPLSLKDLIFTNQTALIQPVR
jgi:tetratricopeptide (TPR) repeat protein